MARAAASCRSAATTAASTPRRCSSCWPAPMPTAPATSRLIDELWPSLLAAMAWIEGDGDSNGDGFVDYARGGRHRARQPGLEGQRGFGVPRRRPRRRGPDRAGRGAGLRLRGVPRHGRSRRRAAARPRTATAGRRKAEQLAGGGRGAVLGRGAGHLRARPRRRTAGPAGCAPPTPGHLLFSGLPAPERAERVAAQLLGAGFNTGWGIRTLAARRAALQPDVLPQRLGLAARHRAVRRRHGALRRAGRRGAAAERACSRPRSSSTCGCPSCSAASRAAPASRRSPIPSPACRRPGPSGVGVHAAAGVPGRCASTAGAARSMSTGRGCRSASTGSPSATSRWARRRVDLTFQRVGDRVAVYLGRRRPEPGPLALARLRRPPMVLHLMVSGVTPRLRMPAGPRTRSAGPPPSRPERRAHGAKAGQRKSRTVNRVSSIIMTSLRRRLR